MSNLEYIMTFLWTVCLSQAVLCSAGRSCGGSWGGGNVRRLFIARCHHSSLLHEAAGVAHVWLGARPQGIRRRRPCDSFRAYQRVAAGRR